MTETLHPLNNNSPPPLCPNPTSPSPQAQTALLFFFKITFYCPVYFFSLCHILSVLFVFLFFFHNYKFKLREACLCLEKQNNKAFISFANLVLRARWELSCKSNISTMNDGGLSLVLKGDNSIVDKIIISWWHLWKRSPCKFLNSVRKIPLLS